MPGPVLFSVRASFKSAIDTERPLRYQKISVNAGVTQLVECNLAKVDVEGSNPFARSTLFAGNCFALR